MLFNMTVHYKAFPVHGLPAPMEVQANGVTVEEALEDVYRGFNHGIPGRTGEMAERFIKERGIKVRSMSVGDEVQVGKDRWLCAAVGFVNLTKNPEAINDPFVKMHRGINE